MGAEVFATKWTPIVLRELLAGSTRFNELQKGMPLMSRTLLSQRLQALEHAGLVEKRAIEGGRGPSYHLTGAGEALRPVVVALGDWAHQWLQHEIPEHNLDPALLMWDVRRTVDGNRFTADSRTVVQFKFDGVPARQRLWWLLVENGDVDLCQKRPAPENDLEVECHLADLTGIWLGHLRLADALADRRVRLEGERHLRDGFGRWFLPSTGAYRG